MLTMVIAMVDTNLVPQHQRCRVAQRQNWAFSHQNKTMHLDFNTFDEMKHATSTCYRFNTFDKLNMLPQNTTFHCAFRPPRNFTTREKCCVPEATPQSKPANLVKSGTPNCFNKTPLATDVGETKRRVNSPAREIHAKTETAKINGRNGAPFLWTTGPLRIHVIWHVNECEIQLKLQNWFVRVILGAVAMWTAMSTNPNVLHSSLELCAKLHTFPPQTFCFSTANAQSSARSLHQLFCHYDFQFSIGLHSLGSGLQPKLLHVAAVDRQWSPSCHPISESTERAVHVEEFGLHSIVPAAP